MGRVTRQTPLSLHSASGSVHATVHVGGKDADSRSQSNSKDCTVPSRYAVSGNDTVRGGGATRTTSREMDSTRDMGSSFFSSSPFPSFSSAPHSSCAFQV